MSAFSHLRLCVGLIHAASFGLLQFSLGVTAPPSARMASSTSARNSRNGTSSAAAAAFASASASPSSSEELNSCR